MDRNTRAAEQDIVLDIPTSLTQVNAATGALRATATALDIQIIAINDI